jgi:two-component system, response regulator
MNYPGKYILLAEDDAVVAELVMHGLASNEPPPHVVHVRDGVEAMNFLFARDKYERRSPGNPALILLDIKMPRLDGLDVLRQIKSDDRLKSTPVVMLTSSQDERDVRESYQLGANAYVVKPVEFRRLMAVLQQIDSFWMQINHPPPETRQVPPSAAPANEERAPRNDFSFKH